MRKASDPITTWARRVQAGKVVAGPHVRAACARHLADLERQVQLGIVWKPQTARWAVAFFAHLMHTRGEWAGKPFVLEPWQAFIIGSLWGWRDATTGYRRFREAYVEVPRKNGKSSIAAGVALLLAFFDEEPGARVYCAATKRDQAKLVWDHAKEIAGRTPALAKRIHLGAHTLSIAAASQKLEPLGADTDVLDGLDVHGAIVDELHAHRTSAMVDILKTATVARRQPLVFYITTAGKERKTICGAFHDYALQVLTSADGLVGVEWFSFIACGDDKDDWRKESTWRKANPNYGVSVSAAALKKDAAKAEQIPVNQSAFRRLHLNEWLQPDNRAIGLQQWAAAGRADVTLDALAGRRCFAGLDLSARLDVTALVLVFDDPDGGIALLPYFFIPEDNIAARVQRDRGAPFDAWVADGLVEATPGNLIDYQAIRRKLVELGALVQVDTVATDPWNAAALGTDIRADGFDLVEVPQRMTTLSEPTKHLLALLESGKLRHPNHPCLDWMASNLALLIDARGNQMPDKGRSTGRIDGLVAAITALSRLMLAPTGESAYADHGLVTV
jgi:phage terminase large subunit-like protein